MAAWLSGSYCRAEIIDDSARAAKAAVMTRALRVSEECAAFAGQRLDHRHHPVELFLFGNTFRTGTRRFPANVENVGTFLCEMQAMGDRCIRHAWRPPSRRNPA